MHTSCMLWLIYVLKARKLRKLQGLCQRPSVWSLPPRLLIIIPSMWILGKLHFLCKFSQLKCNAALWVLPPGCWREVTSQNNQRRAKSTSSLVNNPPVFLGSVIVMTVVMLWLNKTILQTRDNKSIMINSFFGSICALERFILLELEFWPINRPGPCWLRQELKEC